MHTSAVLARWDCLTQSVYHSGFRARPRGRHVCGRAPLRARPVPRTHRLPLLRTGPVLEGTIALNAENHLRELRHAVDEALQDFGLRPENFGDRVRLAEGEELLAREFGSVTRHDFGSELVMTDLAPMEADLMSSINMAGVPEEGREDYVRRVWSNLSPGR